MTFHGGDLWLLPSLYLLPNQSRVVRMARNGTVVRVYPFVYPSLWLTVDVFVTSATVYVLVQNYTAVALVGISVASGQQTSALALPARSYWAGIDRNGTTVAVSSPSGNAVQLLDARTGQVRATLNGNDRRLQVRTATLHPSGSRVLLINGTATTQPYKFNVAAIDADTDTVAWTAALPLNSYIRDMSLDETGAYLLVGYATYNASGGGDFIQQFDANTGATLRVDAIESDGQGLGDAIAADSSGGVWFSQAFSQRLGYVANDSSIRYVPIGTVPLLHSPSDLTALPDGSGVIVGQTYLTLQPVVGLSLHALVLDRTGNLIADLPPSSDTDVCNAMPGQSVAVDRQGRAYSTQCNSTVLVWNLTSPQPRVLHRVDAGADARPRAVRPGPNDTVYLTDDRPQVGIVQVDIHTSRVVSVLASHGGQYSGLAVDGDGSLWTTDFDQGQVLHLAVNGSILSTWDLSDGVARHNVNSLDLDPKHARVIVTEDVLPPARACNVLWLDAHTGAVLYRFALPVSEVLASVAVSADGSTVYVALLVGDAILLFDNDLPQPRLRTGDACEGGRFVAAQSAVSA